MFTKDELLAACREGLLMVPVEVEGHPLVRAGKVIPHLGNSIVVAEEGGRVVAEGTFSWCAVAQALNERDCRLRLPNFIPKVVTPRLPWETIKRLKWPSE